MLLIFYWTLNTHYNNFGILTNQDATSSNKEAIYFLGVLVITVFVFWIRYGCLIWVYPVVYVKNQILIVLVQAHVEQCGVYVYCSQGIRYNYC